MGCDIHGWVEKKHNGKWVAVKELKDRDRNYERFAMLAGVRGVGPSPLGIPTDVSDTAKYDIDKWGTDGHSHSYLPLEEAFKKFKASIFFAAKNKDYYSEWDAFGVEIEGIKNESWDDYRLVFWFDN
jgi:hypothetical protein